MLIVKVKEEGSIEKAIKSLSWKIRKAKQYKDIRKYKEFTKKSTKRREVIKKAKYKQMKYNENNF